MPGKAFTLGTHRVRSPDDTLETLRPKLPLIGVTRVADITGLDHIGIPVAAAIRPASRALSVQQGKGATVAAAKVSAVMESLEGYAAEQPLTHEMRRLADLGPDETALPDHLALAPLSSQALLPFVNAVDLIGGHGCRVPEELVRFDHTLPRAAGYGRFAMSTNGLAAGNTRAEALLHALCEVIERDAMTLWLLRSPAGKRATRVDPLSAQDATASDMARRLADAGMEVELWETTSDIGVPSFFCLIDDRHGRPPFLGRFGGGGCHPHVGVAVCRALAEAAQSRVTLISGARDDIAPEAYAGIGWKRNIGSLIARLARPRAEKTRPIRARSFDRSTVEADLDAVLDRLARRGIDCVAAIDLTVPAIGFPVWRVVVPALEGAHDRQGHRPGPRAVAAGAR